MSWAPKRFWTAASVVDVEQGFGIALDGRVVKTPAKAALIVPTRAMAQALAVEWDAQTDKVDPATMPLTRMANSAIDKVTAQHGEVADYVAAYGETDLLCYRADAPADLVARQAAGWDPLLDWAGDALAAPLRVTTGIIPVDQPAETLIALRTRVHALDPWDLTAVHDLVGLSGSLILGLAIAAGRVDADSAWTLSRIDEDYQAEHWGVDEDAAALAQHKAQGLRDAERFWTLLHGTGSQYIAQ